MSQSVDLTIVESAISTLSAVKERLMGGASIESGEDLYEWILETNQALTEILDRADGN